MDLEELTALEPESPQTEHAVYELFKWSLILKGLISLGEVLAGLALLTIPSSLVVSAVDFARTSLSVYAHGDLTLHVLQEFEKFSEGTVIFVALYLLSRGLIKCVLIWALLKNQLWAYPASLVVLACFVLYQIYEVALGSLLVAGITIFDVIVMYFIWREWRIVLRHNASKQTPVH